ncbi:MAG: ABC transporter ATP-binding protein [Streptococcaceae bacterium]|jgi:putative ABC transport system ATP-binding protein|nr:ABC transporter ATP-binding protein [Streptococcaceae bacterium]
MLFIQAENMTKQYGTGENLVIANKALNFEIQKGELTLILGESGAGKSTLLNSLGAMDDITSGKLIIDHQDIALFNEKERTKFRREQIGFVFQFYNVIQNLTALENVELASEVSKNALNPRETLEKVGLRNRINNFPAQLSGGEQQRVAIARAIAKNPSLLLADEPTGALDYHTGKKILQLFQDFVKNTGKNVIIVTHNSLLKPMADHIIELRDGEIKRDYRNEEITSVSQLEW